MPPSPVSTGFAVIGSFNSKICTSNSNYYQPRGRHLILGAKQSLIVDSSATGTTGSMILGGIYNSASNSSLSHIIGGSYNVMNSATAAVIAGGTLNTASGNLSFLAGGLSNEISGDCSFIGSGNNNVVNDDKSSIIGGLNNTLESECSFIGGGSTNRILGGSGGNAGGGFIGSGLCNLICTTTTAVANAIVGGQCNKICATIAPYNFIGGGCGNFINSSTSECSNVIVGGIANTSSGAFSGILGGKNNNINNHTCSFIVGADITSTANCTTFVNNFHSTGSNGSSNVVILANLPTSDPGVAGQVWRSGNDLKISTG